MYIRLLGWIIFVSSVFGIVHSTVFSNAQAQTQTLAQAQAQDSVFRQEFGRNTKSTDAGRGNAKEPWPIIPAARKMVEEELIPQGKLENAAVLGAMMRVAREKFVPPLHRIAAYRDTALPIGEAQTISPPYIVAYMTEQLDPGPDDKVLEIGTGSGYQAAVLSLLVKEVYSIEIVEPLGKRAGQTLKKLGFKNVFTKIGDGYKGWPDAAPFDKIIVTCSPESVPKPLVDQLKEGGRMIVPVGERYQQMFYLFRKKGGELEKEALTPALFVPMTGEAEANRVVLPDPANPKIVGGDFEETNDAGHPIGWHYARNVKIIGDADVPSGLKFARFYLNPDPSMFLATPRSGEVRGTSKKNETDSQNLRSAQMIQGFAVDGKKVARLKVDAALRGERIVSLVPYRPKPAGTIVIQFYDEDRDVIQTFPLAPAVGTFPWKTFSTRIPVPKKAKEAILFVGLFETSGQLDVDAVSIRGESK